MQFNTLTETENVAHTCVIKCRCVLRCVVLRVQNSGLCWRTLFMNIVIIIAEKCCEWRESAAHGVWDWLWPLVRTRIPCGTWPQWRKWHRTLAEKEWGRCDLWPLREVVTRTLSWLDALSSFKATLALSSYRTARSSLLYRIPAADDGGSEELVCFWIVEFLDGIMFYYIMVFYVILLCTIIRH